MTALFIDVSHHDWDRRGSALDWNAIRNAGLGTVMSARASYGDPQIFNPPSPHFGDYMVSAKDAGFTCRGAYHNLIKGDQTSVNRQVDLLRSTMDKYGAEWAMADIEAYDELKANGLVPDWSTIQRFHDRWYQVDSRKMSWYIAHWFWRDYIGSPNLTGLRGALINADYPGVTGAPSTAYATAANTGRGFISMGGRMPDIWQFGSTLTVPGASSNTDCNVFKGTVSELVSLLSNGTSNVGSTDMPIIVRVNETGACWISDGPSRSGIASMEHLKELQSAWGVQLRGIPQALLSAHGVDLGASQPPFTLSDAQMAQLGFNADDLVAVEASVTKGVMAAMPSVVDALMSKLPANTMTREDVEIAVRDAFKDGLAPDSDVPV